MDRKLKSRVIALLDEADLAADTRTNGLLDRDEFPIILLKLTTLIRELAAECEGAAYLPDEPEKTRLPIGSATSLTGSVAPLQ